MRATQFLKEYDDLEAEKQGIISAISGLRADNQEDAKLLDRIYKILNTGQIGQNISNAFAVPLEGEPLSDNCLLYTSPSPRD